MVDVLRNLTNLRRYSEIFAVMAKHGFADVLEESGVARLIPGWEQPGAAARGETRAENLRLALEELGPTFIKLGQILSTRTDFLPATYTQELEKLQDNVPPFPGDVARHTVEEELHAPLDRLFLSFSDIPEASASLAQVHSAVLNNGDLAVVKIQRPSVRPVINRDLSALRSLASFLERRSRYAAIYDFAGVVDQLAQTLQEELDYYREARNMQVLRRNLAEFDLIRVPRVYTSLSAGRVLTMERIRGKRIPEVLGKSGERHEELARQFITAYLKQVLIDGFFHADPHPGNLYLCDDGTLALMDFGMVGRLDEGTRKVLARLLWAFSRGRADETSDLIIQLAERPDDFDRDSFERRIGSLVAKYRGPALQEINLGEALTEATRVALRHRLRLASTLTLFGKTLVQVEDIARLLDPLASPVAIVQSFAQRIVGAELRGQVNLDTVVRSLLDSAELALALPGRLNTILHDMTDGDLRIQFEHRGLGKHMADLNRIANRLAFAVIVAAVIVGSALVMQTNVQPHILGYPALGVAGFILAGILGLYLIYTILRSRAL